MNKRDIQIIGQKIINAEREIALGKDVQSNEDKIQKYMENLSPADLLAVTFYVEDFLG
jgi:predicted small secreted protein